MSEENVEIVRRFMDASNRRDLATLLSLCDPDIEIETGRLLMGTPTYRGQAGIERYFRDMAAAWKEFQAEVLEIVAVGSNEVVFVGRGSGSGKTTGAPVSADAALSIEFANGKIARVEFFPTKEEALEAAGLSE
jgi:ketosteroid isomerase-like protein